MQFLYVASARWCIQMSSQCIDLNPPGVWKHKNAFGFHIICRHWKCPRLITFTPREDENIHIAHSQYYVSWWAGDAGSQCISSIDIDLVWVEYSSRRSRGRFKIIQELLDVRALKCFHMWIKYTSSNVWVRYFVWNFKGNLWNSTQNILPIHWKLDIETTVKF